MRSLPVIPWWGGQSSFDYEHVESFKKNSRSESLVCHTQGGQSSFDHAHVESKKSQSDPGQSYLGGQSSFHYVHVESLKKSKSDPGQSYPGWSIIF